MGLTAPLACGIIPGPGINMVSPVLQDRFLTTGPPGKPLSCKFLLLLKMVQGQEYTVDHIKLKLLPIIIFDFIFVGKYT